MTVRWNGQSVHLPLNHDANPGETAQISDVDTRHAVMVLFFSPELIIPKGENTVPRQLQHLIFKYTSRTSTLLAVPKKICYYETIFQDKSNNTNLYNFLAIDHDETKKTFDQG
jgi:hypothetical protein